MKTNKQMKDELTGIDIRDYYHSLSKAQKGELLRYAVSQLESATLQWSTN